MILGVAEHRVGEGGGGSAAGRGGSQWMGSMKKKGTKFFIFFI